MFQPIFLFIVLKELFIYVAESQISLVLQKERKFSVCVFYNQSNLSHEPPLLGEGIGGSGGQQELKTYQ